MKELKSILNKFHTPYILNNRINKQNLSINITSISINSKSVKKGSLFIALDGKNFHGVKFVKNAIKNGAKAILVENSIKNKENNFYIKSFCKNDKKNSVDQKKHNSFSSSFNGSLSSSFSTTPIFFGNNLREKLGNVTSWFNDYPSNNLKIIGVTGTNGKTTICYFLYNAIKNINKKAGLLGTIEIKINNKSYLSERTTLEPTQLQELFKKMLKKQVKMCAMEVSSQAIAQQRVNGTKFELLVFTNLSQDHLDYHKTMKNYFFEKAKIFNEKFTKNALISIDDKWGRELVKKAKNNIKVYTFSATGKKADWNFKETLHGFTINNVKSSTKLFGRFNKINAALAIVASKICNIKHSESVIEKIKNIPGRSEIINKKPRIIIDYAHTPDAIKKLLQELKASTTGKLITVLGAGGDRDKKKRPLMSKAAVLYSDYFIITDDNPRNENPDKIRSELQKAIITNKNIYNIKGRRNGIKKAISLATKNDTIAILGKGHDKYIEIKQKKIPFSDKEIALNLIN